MPATQTQWHHLERDPKSSCRILLDYQSAKDRREARRWHWWHIAIYVFVFLIFSYVVGFIYMLCFMDIAG